MSLGGPYIYRAQAGQITLEVAPEDHRPLWCAFVLSESRAGFADRLVAQEWAEAMLCNIVRGAGHILGLNITD